MLLALWLSYFQALINASIPYTYNGSNNHPIKVLPQHSLLFLRIRGGENANDDDIVEMEDGIHQASEGTTKKTRKPWAPLSSAFQMNLDAKEELINDRLLIQDSRGSTGTAVASSLSLGGGGGSVGVTSKRKPIYEERRVVSDGETEEDVSTASNRLLTDEDDLFELSENEDFSEDVYDALSEEYQGSFVIENDAGLERNIEAEDQHNVTKKSSKNVVEEPSDMEGPMQLEGSADALTREDIDDVLEMNLNYSLTETQILEEDDIHRSEEEIQSIEREVSADIKVKDEMTSTDGNLQLADETEGSSITTTTALQSSTIDEDSQNYESIPSVESLQEIVYEEWKDAETDVESSNHSKRERKNNKGKNKGNNKKRNKREKRTEKVKKAKPIYDKNIEMSPKTHVGKIEPISQVANGIPESTKSEQSSAPLLAAPREGLASPYVSSGWVS